VDLNDCTFLQLGYVLKADTIIQRRSGVFYFNLQAPAPICGQHNAVEHYLTLATKINQLRHQRDEH
jgi:hypothetical protein